MRIRFGATVALLAGLALAAGAVPAFTADSGSVAVSVTAQAPPAPCLTVTPGTLQLGTYPFSTPSQKTDVFPNVSVRTENCGTAAQNVAVVGTDATGASGDWTLGRWDVDAPPVGNPCVARPNLYFFHTNGSAGPDVQLWGQPITKTSELLGTSPNGDPGVWAPAARADIAFRLIMPCQGSNGAGETKTFSVTFTAIVV